MHTNKQAATTITNTTKTQSLTPPAGLPYLYIPARERRDETTRHDSLYSRDDGPLSPDTALHCTALHLPIQPCRFNLYQQTPLYPYLFIPIPYHTIPYHTIQSTDYQQQPTK